MKFLPEKFGWISGGSWTRGDQLIYLESVNIDEVFKTNTTEKKKLVELMETILFKRNHSFLEGLCKRLKIKNKDNEIKEINYKSISEKVYSGHPEDWDISLAVSMYPNLNSGENFQNIGKDLIKTAGWGINLKTGYLKNSERGKMVLATYMNLINDYEFKINSLKDYLIEKVIQQIVKDIDKTMEDPIQEELNKIKKVEEIVIK